MAEAHRQKVDNLSEALSSDGTHAEAVDLLRGLVEKRPFKGSQLPNSPFLSPQGRVEEAEKLLSSALQRDANCADALANLVPVQLALGKSPDACRRYLSQLREAAPHHPFVKVRFSFALDRRCW